MSGLRRHFANLAVACFSLVAIALVLDFVVFRFLFLPADVPRNTYSDGILRYIPNQSGIYRVTNEIAAPFRINGQGWNSGVGDYQQRRVLGRSRIAIVGDSYVEALNVPFDSSLAERTQALLRGTGHEVDVYRFGISGAPLSQYLNILEREVLAYGPDVVVVVLVHNDFDESSLHQRGRYTSSFLKVRPDDGGAIAEIAPVPYTETWKDWLRQRPTVRYLYYRQGVRPIFLRKLVFSPARAQGFQANIDISRVLPRFVEIERTTDYLFGRFAELSRSHGFRLLFVMDAVRSLIYAGQAPAGESAHRLNRLAARLADKHGIAFIDLTDEFQSDWEARGLRFDYRSDNHWNGRGHMVAAMAVDNHVLRHRWLEGE